MLAERAALTVGLLLSSISFSQIVLLRFFDPVDDIRIQLRIFSREIQLFNVVDNFVSGAVKIGKHARDGLCNSRDQVTETLSLLDLDGKVDFNPVGESIVNLLQPDHGGEVHDGDVELIAGSARVDRLDNNIGRSKILLNEIENL